MTGYKNQEQLVGIALVEDLRPRKEDPEDEYPTVWATYTVPPASGPTLIVPHTLKRRRCEIRVLQNAANNATDVVLAGSSSDAQNQVVGQSGFQRLNAGNNVVRYGTSEIWMASIAGGATPYFVSVSYEVCKKKTAGH